MKKILFATLLAICLVLTFVACDEDDVQTLPAPTGVRLENGYIMWNPIDHAVKYTINIDGKEYFCDENKYPIANIKDGEHVITVKANGDDVLYKTSVYSEEFPITLMDGVVASGGYYSQFDELTMQESFLGYGFDVINSSVFYDKTVKTSSPIFKTDELMKLRLLKVDSKRSYISEVQSESIDDFMNSWNADLNVDVSWGKKRIGGSVGVEAAYSGGSATAKSKYFHCMTFNNQKFYIVMQGTTNQYRDIISEGFEQDLYSDMSPAELFNKYGTHFITSAVMGGKINSYYLYTSDKETSFHDVSASVSTNVRYWVGSTTVEASGGYHQLAQSQGIYIKNTMEVIGGGDYGMLSDADISSKYLDWERSLEDHPSLIGIKDSGSLVPIWTLIDPAKDTRTDYQWIDENGKLQTGSRVQQLQGYFMKYGVDNYNALAEATGIPEIKQPESITNILVNGKEPSGGEYEVLSGIGNRVTFTVSPEDALGYSKTIRLSTASDYASISADNTEIVISDNAPHNTLLTVIVSAGDVKQTIKVRVVKTFTVDFETNMDGVAIENPENYQDIRYGRQISAPEMDSPYGWEFVGWYSDPYFNYPYEFGNSPVVDNLTLYAKWVEYRPQISFVTNIDNFTMEPIRVDFASKYVPERTPTCDGYIFKGFYTDPALTNEYDFNFQVASDIVLYLKWEAIEYTATFVAEGNTVKFVKFTLDDDRINEPDVPTKAGYSGRWEDYVIKADNITINAVYSLIEYTVAFNVLSESATSKGYSYDDFESTVVLDKALRNDYLFMGWYDNPDFEGEPIKELTEAKDYTLYAKHLEATEFTSFSTQPDYASEGGSLVYGSYSDIIVVPDIHDGETITEVGSGASLGDVVFILPESVKAVFVTAWGSADNLIIEGMATDVTVCVGGAAVRVGNVIVGDNIKSLTIDVTTEDICDNIFIPNSVTSVNISLGSYCSTTLYFESESQPEISYGEYHSYNSSYTSHLGLSKEEFFETVDEAYTVSYYVLNEAKTEEVFYVTDFIWGIEDLPKPLRNNYQFVGWYDNPEFEGEPITSLTEAKDYTLYAKHLEGSPISASESGFYTDGFEVTYYPSSDNLTEIIVPDIYNNEIITEVYIGSSHNSLKLIVPETVSCVCMTGWGSVGDLEIVGKSKEMSIYVEGAVTNIDNLILYNGIENLYIVVEPENTCNNIFVPNSVESIDITLDRDSYDSAVSIYFESDSLPENTTGINNEYLFYTLGTSLEEFEANISQ